MRPTYISSLISVRLLWLLLAGSLLVACNRNDEDLSGPPVITRVRLLDPATKDSAFTKAYPGTQVLIEGQNLGGITNVYFNDFEAGFNPVYNTSTNLIITIPGNAPTEATRADVPNKLRVVTPRGEAVYDFVLDIPPPVITYIFNENTLPGEEMTIVGSNLWLVDKVVFPGNLEGSAVTTNATGTELKVTVPAALNTSGPLTIQAKYGSVTTVAPVNLHFGPGVISNLTAAWESGEPSVFNWSWWGAQRPTDLANFPGTRGAYLHNIFGGVGANDGGWWNGNRSGNFEPAAVVTDLSALSGPASNYALKFEVNTREPWTSAVNVLLLGNYAYRWKPFATAEGNSFHTGNTWQTITIPLSEFKTNNGNGTPAATLGNLVDADGKASFDFQIISEEAPIPIFNTAFDNFRIVRFR